MSRNILGLLVVALLLVQFSDAVPVPRQELREYVFLESAKFMKDLLTEGTHLIENVKEKAVKIEPKSAELSDFLEKFDQFLHRMKQLNEEELNPETALTIFQLAGSFFEILKRYEHEDFPVEISLKENGKETYTAYYEKSFQKFGEELVARLGHYIGDLSNEEKEAEDNKKLIHWFEEFKANADTRSLTALGPLFEIFDFDADN